MILAREMSGNDADTVAGEYRSLKTMLIWDTVLALRKQAHDRPGRKLGGMNLTYGVRYMTPASVITQALVARYRQDPGNEALRAAINEYVRMHKEQLRPQAIGETTYHDFLDQATDPRHPAGLWILSGVIMERTRHLRSSMGEGRWRCSSGIVKPRTRMHMI